MKLTYVSGLRRDAFDVDWSDKTIIFTHIPKAAGTTLDRVMEKVSSALGENRRRAMGTYLAQKIGGHDPEALDYFRSKIVGTSSPIRYLTGHLPYGVDKFIPGDPAYLTILRDPISRCMSQFRMGVERGIWSEEAPVGELFDSGSLISDTQTRQLSGATDLQQLCDDEMLALALRNLENQYALFTTTARFNELLKVLITLLGWPDIVYSDYQVGGRTISAAKTAEIAEVAASRNQRDQQLYDYTAARPFVWNPKFLACDVPPETERGENVLVVSEAIKVDLDGVQTALIPQAAFEGFQDQLLNANINIDYH